MRCGIGAITLVLQLLVSGSALAASVQFSMDFELVGCPIDLCGNPDAELLDGFFPDAGSFSIDSSLLGDTQTLLQFDQLADFTLSFPAPFFSFDQGNLNEGGCLSDPCGILFTGSRFDGFQGSFAFADDTFTSLVAFEPVDAGTLQFIVSGTPGPGGGVRGGDLLTDDISSARVRIAPVPSSPVPEPASVVLFVAGGALVGRYVRRRKLHSGLE